MRFQIQTFCAILLIPMLGGCAIQKTSDSTCGNKEISNLRSVRTELLDNLKREVLDCWFPRCLDKKNGGYHQYYDYAWRPLSKQLSRGIVGQARLLWTASTAASFLKDDATLRKCARHGFRYLDKVVWDRKYGGWYWSFDDSGKPAGRHGDEKHAYGMSFGIYACSAYYKLSGDNEALALAKKAFLLLDAKAHDAERGGYYESFTRDWRKRISSPTEKLGCPVGNWAGVKSMNTHIHLMESFTALYEIWPDPTLRKRLIELLALITTKMYSECGAFCQYFDPDWHPYPAAESFGHEVETTYLIFETMRVLGVKDASVEAKAKRLTDHAIRYALDGKKAGLCDLGDAFGALFKKEKIFWNQAEYLNSLSCLALRYPKDDRRYAWKFVSQWRFIQENMIDKRHGGWFCIAGSDYANLNKGSFWFTSYHIGRALMNSYRNLGKIKIDSE